MKLLNYCLLCLFAMRVQSKPQVTKLFPVENLMGYQRRATNDMKPLDKFLGRLRASYNYVFRQPGSNTGNIDKILAKNSDSNPQILRVIWPDQIKHENYTDLKYPNNSFVDQVRSLLIAGDGESKINSSSINTDFFDSVEIKSTINALKKSSNNTRTLNDADWFDDIQSLEQLELQDEELTTKKKIENTTATTTHQFPTVVGQNLIEWFGSILSNAYRVYTKLSNTACGKAI